MEAKTQLKLLEDKEKQSANERLMERVLKTKPVTNRGKDCRAQVFVSTHLTRSTGCNGLGVPGPSIT